MTDTPQPDPQKTDDKVSPETLQLRAKPRPVTRINRNLLIGVAAVGLVVLAGIVLVALRPPSFRGPNPNDLANVDRKPISDGLSKLPSSYDGVRTNTPPVVKGTERPLGAGVVQLQTPSADPVAEAERVEKARVSRLAGLAREAPVLFRLQLKEPRTGQPTEAKPAGATTAPSFAPDGNPGALTSLQTADRARAAGVDDNDAAIPTQDQTRKLAFLRSGPEKDIYNPHRLQTPASPYQLMAGTIIAASLVTGLNSDLPGFVIAQVTENVFDSVSGRYLLVPQGSRLIGKYDNVVAFGQERALVVWQRIILPDGSSVVIDNLPATDTGGYAGISDDVDLHTWKLLKGVALATVLGVGSSLAFGSGSGDSDIIRALRESTGQTTNRAGQRLVERQLNVQPTITVRPGWPLRVIVHKDIVLRPYRMPGNP
ncbi:MAG: TrbI/VirB10 family protein [Hyphomicrobiaceae bacterium]|nr:TrbI/VirB10 family protein [Hyphomicrobiaceae bacterium]